MEYIVPSITALSVIIVSIISYHGGKSNRAATHADSIIDLTCQVQKFSQDLSELRKEIDMIEHNNQVLWQYVIALLEQLKKNKITPVKPPAELESDPRIIKIFSSLKK